MAETNNRDISQTLQDGWDDVTSGASDVADKSFKSVKDWLDKPGPVPQFFKKFMIDSETGELSAMAMTAVTGVGLLGGSKFLSITSNGDSTVDQVANPMGFIGKALLAVGLIGALFPMAAKWLGNVGASNGQDEAAEVDNTAARSNQGQDTTLSRLPNQNDLRHDKNGKIYLPSPTELRLSEEISNGDNVDAVEAPSAGQCSTILPVIPSKTC